jgi:hypothetical protein
MLPYTSDASLRAPLPVGAHRLGCGEPVPQGADGRVFSVRSAAFRGLPRNPPAVLAATPFELVAHL